MAFLDGFLVGLGLIILIGPVLFTLLQASFQGGFLSGLAVATGIIVSDVIAVLICMFGAGFLMKNPASMFYFAGLGVVLLLTFGVTYLVKSPEETLKELKLSPKDYFGFFLKGFLVNFVNPFVFAAWLAMIALAKSRYPDPVETWIYLVGTLAAIYFLDTSKAILANKIRPLLKPRILAWIYRIIGVLLLAFAVRLFLWMMEHEIFQGWLNGSR